MKAICLVKQVPALGRDRVRRGDAIAKREGVPLELNAFDRYAVQHGALARGRGRGDDDGPTAGRGGAARCLALGAQRAIHLSDRVFAVADTLGTSRTLALAIEKEGADLVLCGRKALDSETWQVPCQVGRVPRLAACHERRGRRALRRLAPPHARRRTSARRCTRRPPVVVSVGLPPSGANGDADGPIKVWQATDLVGDLQPNDKRFGQTGSPTSVLAVRDSRPERAGIPPRAPTRRRRRCAACSPSAHPSAPSWEKPAHIADEPGASYDCWSVCELVDGRLRRVSLELIASSRELAGKLGGRAVALIIGHELDQAAREASLHGAEVV